MRNWCWVPGEGSQTSCPRDRRVRGGPSPPPTIAERPGPRRSSRAPRSDYVSDRIPHAGADRPEQRAGEQGGLRTPAPSASGPQGALRPWHQRRTPGLPARFLGAKIGRSVSWERGGTGGWGLRGSGEGVGEPEARPEPRAPRSFRAGIPGGNGPAGGSPRIRRDRCFGPCERKLLG